MALPFAVRAPAGRRSREPAWRLFLALWPDAATRQRIDARVRAAGLGGRAVPAANLHMTLVFVGGVPVERVGVLESIVDGQREAGFALRLDRLGRFSGAGVAWAGCRDIPPALTSLQARLDAAVRRAGFAIETRAFRPHVTLARDCSGAIDSSGWEAIVWPVREVALVRSEAGPAGPVYRVLRRSVMRA